MFFYQKEAEEIVIDIDNVQVAKENKEEDSKTVTDFGSDD